MVFVGLQKQNKEITPKSIFNFEGSAFREQVVWVRKDKDTSNLGLNFSFFCSILLEEKVKYIVGRQ